MHSSDVQTTNYEPNIQYKFSEIPVSIAVSNKKFVLFGAFLFTPSPVPGDIGHYTAAIKINDQWEIYDDMSTKAAHWNKDKHVIIHTIFYICEQE